MAINRQTGSASASSDAEASRRIGPYSYLAPVLAFLSCVLYSCNGGLVFVPHFLFWKPAGGDANLRMNVQWGSFFLALLLMSYNYAWLLSARYLAAGLTNAVFQTSVAMVYLASVFIFNEKLEQPAVVGVMFALLGAFLASGFNRSDLTVSQNFNAGLLLAFCAATGYMMYQVWFKYFYGHLKSDPRFLAHIGAWVSIWHIIVILPLAGLAHLTGFELMQLPHGHLAVGGTIASACIASTVNAMYICMVMWGSMMLLPCASAMSVPFTVGLDMILHNIVPGRLEILGHLMVVFSVVLIMGLHTPVMLRMKAKTYGATSIPR